jgi:hypothetical protein
MIEKFPPEYMGMWLHECLRCMKEIFLHLLTDLKISPMVSHPEILPCAGWKSTPPAPVRMTITPLPVILRGCEKIPPKKKNTYESQPASTRIGHSSFMTRE